MGLIGCAILWLAKKAILGLLFFFFFSNFPIKYVDCRHIKNVVKCRKDLFLHFINKIRIGCSEESTMILEFLKNYQRMTVPSDDEIDVWVNSRPEPFPAELAKLRLPFHPLLKAQYIY